MLALAIILTIVTGLMFAAAFVIGGYILYVMIRQHHRSAFGSPPSEGSGAESLTGPSA